MQALSDAKPDAVFNVLFGADLSKFVREGNTRGLFKGIEVVSVLDGRARIHGPPERRGPQRLVTGYPHGINTRTQGVRAGVPGQVQGLPAPGLGVGYSMIKSAATGIAKAKSTDTDKLVAASRACR